MSLKSNALIELQTASSRCASLSKEIEGLGGQLLSLEQVNSNLRKELQNSGMELNQVRESLRQSEAMAETYSEELRKHRDILSYINRISAENEALRRLSNAR